MEMIIETRFVFLLGPFSLVLAIFIGSRHFITFLMLLELLGVSVFVFLCLCSPVEWIHLVTYVLVLGAREAAIGLSVIVKLSRSIGRDRVSVISLLRVRSLKKW